MATIKLVQGDTPTVQFTLYNKQVDTAGVVTTTAIDLTNVTSILLKWRQVGATTSTNITGTIQTPLTSGIVWFNFPSPILASALGDYEGEIELTTNSGSVFTVYGVQKFHVRAQF